MSRVGMWNGVDAGAGRVESDDRKAQNANYNAQAQRYNIQKAFSSCALDFRPG